MAARIRMTQRRDMMLSARHRAADNVSALIQPALNRQHRALERFLRSGGNLKKRVSRAEPLLIASTTPGVVDAPLYPAQLKVNGLLLKVEQDQQSWLNWKTALTAVIIAALLRNAGDLGDVENLVWESRGFSALTFDPQQLIDDYQLRTGRSVGDVADSTMAGVQQTITDWYLEDLPFSTLMDRLDRWFSEARANAIASTEVGNVISQIVTQEMVSRHWHEWYWDAMGENPCENHPITLINVTYSGCRELNGHKFPIGTPMPPDAAHPNCECLPTPVVE